MGELDYKNTFDEFMSKLNLKTKVVEGLLNVSRQMIHKYRNMDQFIDLPLSALIRILFYSGCETIFEFEELVADLDQKSNQELVSKLEKIGGILYNKNKEEKSLGIQMLMSGEITVMDIARIGNNIKKEYPLITQSKIDNTIKKTSEDLDTDKVEHITRIHIFRDLSDSYVKLIEELLNKILKNGNDYNLLAELDRYIKSKGLGE
jgi:hypothetical protein